MIFEMWAEIAAMDRKGWVFGTPHMTPEPPLLDQSLYRESSSGES